MKENTLTIDLKCSVCGTKTGEAEIVADERYAAEDITPDMIGIESVRCDEHPPEPVEPEVEEFVRTESDIIY